VRGGGGLFFVRLSPGEIKRRFVRNEDLNFV
jgi:hypothetical protein